MKRAKIVIDSAHAKLLIKGERIALKIPPDTETLELSFCVAAVDKKAVDQMLSDLLRSFRV